MNLVKSKKFIFIWLFIFIPMLSLLLLRKTFNLALYGDDWLQLYNLWLSFDVHKSLSFFDIRSYLGAYWPQYLFLGIIRNFFGYQPQAYFAASLLLKILATISLFFLVNEISKSRSAALFATLIFTFSVSGIQTTDWVFNMNTFAGIFFLNLALFFYFKVRKINSFFSPYYLAFTVFFILSLWVVPVRMHGAVPFILIIELFLYFFVEKNKLINLNIFFFARVILPVAVMFLLIKVGSFGSSGDTLPLIEKGYIYLQEMMKKGRYDILFYFLGIIGNISLPDTIDKGAVINYSLPRLMLFTSLGLFFAFSVLGNKSSYIMILIANIFWAVISKLLVFWNPSLNIDNIFSISLGFQVLFLSYFLFIRNYKRYPNLSLSAVIGILWIIFFSFLYWWRDPYIIIESSGRYMTMGAVGFAIFFASALLIVINNLRGKALFYFPVILLIGWLGINYISIQSYLNNLEINRNLALANKTWDTIRREVPKLDSDGPSVFYFTYDNSTAANMLLIFGFWPHAGLSYEISNWENTPLPTENYEELLDMVKTGESLKKIHARPLKPVPVSRVFAFDLRNGELTSITAVIRSKLSKDLMENGN